MRKSKRVKLLHDVASDLEAARGNIGMYFGFVDPNDVEKNWLWTHIGHIAESLSVLAEVSGL